MDILKELYFGNIRPSERAIKEGSDYQKALSEVCALENAFRAELSAEGKKVYDAYVTKRLTLLETDDCDSFIKGYRLGVKLLLGPAGLRHAAAANHGGITAQAASSEKSRNTNTKNECFRRFPLCSV